MSSLETIRPQYVLDTHALLWYLKDDQKLPQRVRDIFDAARRGDTLLVVSAIVLAELHYVNGKHGLFVDFQQQLQQLLKRPEFVFVPLEPRDILDFDHDRAVPEMHDRIITGLARRLNAPLITLDPLIKAAGLVEIVW